MNISIFKRHLIKFKLATLTCVIASVAAFASLGDGGKKKSSVVVYNFSKTFSLRSNFIYKSDNILNTPETNKFVMLNTVVTYQRGNTTYILPLKKKVLLDKIKFHPSYK